MSTYGILSFKNQELRLTCAGVLYADEISVVRPDSLEKLLHD